MRRGIPSMILAERLAFVLKSARLKADTAPLLLLIEEAEGLVEQLKEGLQ